MPEPARNLGLELTRVARSASERPALTDPEEALSYAELLESAHGLAASLPAPGEAPRPVALLMPHRARTIVAMLAAMIAGRPYCVLNPAQPRRRLEALLAAIDADVVWVSDGSLCDRLQAVGVQSTVPEPTRRRNRGRQPPDEGSNELCALYVTSGTSGFPKVVGYRHRATHHRAERYAAVIAAGPDDRFSLVSPLWTAAAASAVFTALLSGASLHLLEPGRVAPAALADRAAATGITVWHSTPSLFRRLAGAGALDQNRFRVLRLGGEALLPTDLELARRICPKETLLVTGYSLTEANGAVTQKAVPLGRIDAGAILDAGRPVPGVELLMENRAGEPAAAGEEGEIVIGGEFLSAGYSESEEPSTETPSKPRTDTRFTHRGRALVLHTGDRGMLRADGSLEVRGRDDGRLKVRGHRIDPIEVEAAALRQSGVLDAALVPFAAAAGSMATALFALRDPRRGRVTSRSLRAHLEGLIAPEAMPASVRVLNRWPQTASGKPDRLRLARMADGADREREARLGRDSLVDHLVRLMRESLEIEALAPDEDFFNLGGDSLGAFEVCAEVESIFGIPMEPATLLRHRSARALAEHIRDSLSAAPEAPAKSLHLNPGGGEVPLFVVPGAGSEATALVHFAEAIGPQQPVIAIQLPGVDGRTRPLIRMDEITAHCLLAIRETGIRPPYRLAGTSFGGLVAYDVASELLRDGVETEYLGLFDTPAPRTRRRGYLIDPLRRFRVPPNLSARTVSRHPRAELKRFRAPLGKLLLDYRATGSLLLGLGWKPPIDLRFFHLRTACLIAANRWTSPRIPIPFHLYRCESQSARLANAAVLGWDRHAADITVRRIPSAHGEHIRPPAVSDLAAMVNDDLSRSRPRRPAGVA